MKTYSDEHLRGLLRKQLEISSYRILANHIGTNHAYLHRMVNAGRPISFEVASFLGFGAASIIPDRWIKKAK